MKTKDPVIEKLLARSIEQYTKILLHSDKLIDMLGAFDYANISQYALDLEEMQNTARKEDKVLMEQIEKNLQ